MLIEIVFLNLSDVLALTVLVFSLKNYQPIVLCIFII